MNVVQRASAVAYAQDFWRLLGVRPSFLDDVYDRGPTVVRDATIPLPQRQLHDCQIVTARDSRTLADWFEAYVEAFNLAHQQRSEAWELFDTDEHGPGRRITHVAVLWESRPVGCGTLVDDGEVAVFGNVALVPHARDDRVAWMLISALVEDARKRGVEMVTGRLPRYTHRAARLAGFRLA
jgi:hypothetical protein